MQASPIYAATSTSASSMTPSSVASPSTSGSEVRLPTRKRGHRSSLNYEKMPPRFEGKVPLELISCQRLLDSLLERKCNTFAWPFYEPVDPVALKIPTYFDIVTHPMDLSTIRQKLSYKQYINAGEFHDDLKLMCENCWAFNRPGDVVYVCGEQLWKFVEKEWDRYFEDGKPRSKPKKPRLGGLSVQECLDRLSREDDIRRNWLYRATKFREELNALAERNKEMPTDLRKRLDEFLGNAPASAATTPKSRKRPTHEVVSSNGSEVTSLTVEELNRIVERITTLDDVQLVEVAKLIRIGEEMDELRLTEGFEMDFHKMKPATVHAIHDYLNKLDAYESVQHTPRSSSSTSSDSSSDDSSSEDETKAP
ncbi:unnamed protein product, partial [Mesorhabditis spiculigera]